MNFASSRPKILILAVIAVLSLTACEQRGPQPPEITIHAIAEGYSTLTTPAEWNLQEEELQPWQEHQAFSTSLRIQDAEGRDMAVLMTGGVGPIDVRGSPEGEKYTQLERGDSALAKENHFSFDAWRDDGQTASINLNFRPPEVRTTLRASRCFSTAGSMGSSHGKSWATNLSPASRQNSTTWNG